MRFCSRPIDVPHARKFIEQSQRVRDNSLNVSSSADNLSSRWEKCNALNQRSTKITTNVEYSNFDFQVCYKTVDDFDEVLPTNESFFLAGMDENERILGQIV